MKTTILFPNSWKRLGWIILIPSAFLGVLLVFFDLQFSFLELPVFTIYTNGFGGKQTWFGFFEGNYTNTLVGALVIIGGMFVAFSKEKKEDEFIAKTRLESLIWAVFINYSVLLFGMLFFFNLEFLNVMIFNMFTVLIIFIIRFNYMLLKSKKTIDNEK